MPVVSTDFSGPALDPALATYKPASLQAVTFASGRARFEPVAGGAGATNAFWFNANDGPLTYYVVTGDFDAVLDCLVRDEVDDVSLPPVDGSFRIAGLAAHDPNRATLNYVHCGFGCTDARRAAEWKDTRDSASVFGDIAWPSCDGQLRVERIGQLFNVYCRLLPTDPWTLLQAIDRTANPMPTVLHVGVIVYASDVDHEIVILADELAITTAAAPLVAGAAAPLEDPMDASAALRLFDRGRSRTEPTRTPITVAAEDTLLGPAAQAGVLVMPVGGFLVPADDVTLTFYSGDPASTGVAITGPIPARGGVPIQLGPWLHPNEGDALYVRRGSAVAAAGNIHTVGL